MCVDGEGEAGRELCSHPRGWSVRRAALLALLVHLAMGLPLRAEKSEAGVQEVTHALGERILIRAESGDIRIEPSEDGQTRVRWEILFHGPERKGIEIVVDSGSEGLEISADRPKGLHASVHFRLAIDPSLPVAAETESGAIVIQDVVGDIEASSLSGTIHLIRTHGNTSVGTIDGDIEAEDNQGELRVRTVSGDVHITGGDGALTVESGYGSIFVKDSQARTMNLSSISGDLTVHAGLLSESEYRLRSHHGLVTVWIASSSPLDLRAKSFRGSIVCSLGIDSTHSDRNRLEGAINGGGALLEILTFSGDIRIEPR